MIAEPLSLQNKFADFLRWERQKRRQESFLLAAGIALASALLLSPLHGLLPWSGLRWLVPVILMLGLAPAFWYCRRWRAVDTTRALVDLDRKLGLDERAVTAWELAQRGDSSAVAQLVFQQTEPHLRGLEARRLFPRQWDWPDYSAAPLLLFWFWLLWFNFDQFSQQRSTPTPSLAQQLREFASD
ncbi:MAG TPA: hypothetical protein VF208_08485, partial [Candidatus Binatia bacterium]